MKFQKKLIDGSITFRTYDTDDAPVDKNAFAYIWVKEDDKNARAQIVTLTREDYLELADLMQNGKI